jgi:adenylate cyclase
MGSDFRFNYPVLGDTVNVASRLEGRTKDYRIPIVIGAGTEQNAREKFARLEIDRIQVKGKTQPETVFTLLGRAELAGPEFPGIARPHRQDVRVLPRAGLDAGDAGSHRALPQGFRTVRHQRALFDMYAERIEAFRRNPPPPDWNGVYEAESK